MHGLMLTMIYWLKILYYQIIFVGGNINHER